MEKVSPLMTISVSSMMAKMESIRMLDCGGVSIRR